jgi:hypothetical protein
VFDPQHGGFAAVEIARSVRYRRIGLTTCVKAMAKELRQTGTKPADYGFPSNGVVGSVTSDQLDDMVQDRQITLPEAKAASI